MVRAWEALRGNGSSDWLEIVPDRIRRDPDELQYVLDHSSATGRSLDEIGEELPKLGDYENWVQWNQRWTEGYDIFQSRIDDILDELPEGSFVGFRGSLASGQRYNGGMPWPFDPERFDIDGFIVSDDFAAQFTGPGWRNAADESEALRVIGDQLDADFRYALPGYREDDPFKFRVWTTAEFIDIVQPNGFIMIE
jgi:filamentous hemagglutinin